MSKKSLRVNHSSAGEGSENDEKDHRADEGGQESADGEGSGTHGDPD